MISKQLNIELSSTRPSSEEQRERLIKANPICISKTDLDKINRASHELATRFELK